MPQDGSLIDRLLHEKDSRPAESSVGSVKDWFKSTFKRELPIGSFGLDAGHKRMGWEHSRAFDVSLHPSSAEGQQLIKYLESQGISYIASQGASKNATGQVTSTGPHIHVGPPSSRLTKSVPSSNSLVDKLLAAKEGGSAPVVAGTQSAQKTDTVDRFTTIRKQRLTSDKLAADIEWHFGYSTLRAMPTYTPEQQRGVVERARMAAEDDIRKGAAYKAATGKELSLKRDPAWQERNRRDLGLTGDKILDRMYWDTEYAGGTAEDAAKWNKKVREETNFVQNNVFGPTNARIFGGASKTVLDLAAGATDLGRKILTPGRKPNAATEWLREQSSKIAGGIEEAESIRPTGTTYELDMPYIGKVPVNPRKGAEELASGALVYGPLVALIPALGIEGVMARLGAQLAIGGTTEGLQSVGRDESWKDVGKHTAAGALQFGLFEVPLAGRTVLRKALSNAVIMGGGTTIINRATGQPWSESAKAGLLMMLLRSPELLKNIKVRTPTDQLNAAIKERPATQTDIDTIARDFPKHQAAAIQRFEQALSVEKRAPAILDPTKPVNISARIKELNKSIKRVESELMTASIAKGRTGKTQGLLRTIEKRLDLLTNERNALLDPKLEALLTGQTQAEVVAARRARKAGVLPAPVARPNKAEVTPLKLTPFELPSGRKTPKEAETALRSRMAPEPTRYTPPQELDVSPRGASEMQDKWKGQRGAASVDIMANIATLGLPEAIARLRKMFPHLSEVEIRALIQQNRPELLAGEAGRVTLPEPPLWGARAGEAAKETMNRNRQDHINVLQKEWDTTNDKMRDGRLPLSDRLEEIQNRRALELERLYEEANKAAGRNPYDDIVQRVLGEKKPRVKDMGIEDLGSVETPRLPVGVHETSKQLNPAQKFAETGEFAADRVSIYNEPLPKKAPSPKLYVAPKDQLAYVKSMMSPRQLAGFRETLADLVDPITELRRRYDLLKAREARGEIVPYGVQDLDKWGGQRGSASLEAISLGILPALEKLRKEFPHLKDIELRAILQRERPELFRTVEAKGQKYISDGVSWYFKEISPTSKVTSAPKLKELNSRVSLPKLTSERRGVERTDADTLIYAQSIAAETGRTIKQSPSGQYEIVSGDGKNTMMVGKGGLRETTEYLRDQSTRSLLSKGVKLSAPPARGLIPEGVESGILKPDGTIEWAQQRKFAPTGRVRFEGHNEIRQRLGVASEDISVYPPVFRKGSKVVTLTELQAVKGNFDRAFATDPIVELNIGLNPAAALRKADNLERPGFTIDRGERAGRDYGSQARDSFRTPQSNLEFQGWLETILGPLGKKASDALRTYQINKEARRFEWQRKVGAIESHLERARGKADKETFFGDFIDLIEKEFTDPTRRSNRPDIQEALEMHDALTAQWRQYIIDTRRGLGIEMPDGWGITDRGYFRHLFLGDIKLYKTVNGVTTWIGRVETYAEAQKVALETMRNEPGATVHANAKNQFNADPTQRLSTGKFWKTVSNLLKSTRETATNAAGGRVHLTQGDILEDVRGTIGLQKSKLKPFGALLKRRGFAGSLQDYTRVMEIHAGQLSRTQELSKFNREWVPMIEEAGKTHPMAAKEMQRLLDDIWGVPRKVEELIGSRVRATPVLRNVVANPDAALRNFTQGSASAQVAAKLDFNARASAINALDPLNTLWPHVSTVEFTKLYADFAKPSTRQMLRDRGVLTGASKFTEGVSEHGKKGFKQRWQDLMGAQGAKEIAKALWKLPARPFRMVSDMNRGVGYLHGIEDGTQKGLTGDALHRHGLDWARKVEFDNAKENAAAILRGPLGQLFGQFKGYPMKALENWVTVWHRYPADTNKSLTTRRAKLLASKLAIGGIKTLTSPLRWLGIASGYALVEAVSAGLQEVGFGKETADEAAQMTYYGPPAKGGFDFSASVALIDDPYGHTPEEVLVNTLGGPTVGTIFGLMKAKTLEKAANVVTPYSRAYYGGTEMAERGFVSVPAQHGERLSLNLHESIGYLFGFTPVRRSISFDQPAKKVGMDKLKERMRAGDANVLKEMTEAAQNGEMPVEDMKEVIHSLKTTEKQAQFKRLTLSQAEYVYSGLSSEDQVAVWDVLRIKRVNAKQDPETGKPINAP